MSHVSVLLNELIQSIDIKSGKNYLDCTFGAGGHSKEILKLGGKVTAIDRDINVVNFVDDLKKQFNDNFEFLNIKFSDIKSHIDVKNFDAIYYDFGVSSMRNRR